MSKSDIVFNLQYKLPKNKKTSIAKWVNYASDKKKADSSSIDEYNILKDYALYSDKDAYLTEKDETFIWSNKGDVSKKEVINSLKDMNYSGIFWRGFLSFPSEFAYSHGLITKADFYSLTNQVMPTLIINMGLDINNTTWLCTLHRNTAHPHIHICIFENKPTKTNPRYPKSCIYKFKSAIGNYLIDSRKFYELRDKTFTNITGTINLKELNRLKSQRLFSDEYRKGLNKLLLEFYKRLPVEGRLQYNSKNMKPYKVQLDNIIEYILLHDSVKYEYANYLKLLEKHQRELNQLYGMSDSNKQRKYYDEQLNRLYSKIGNEILKNFKRYQAMDFMEREQEFLKKHISDLNFKSRKDYSKEETKKEIARELYKICVMAGLSEKQIEKVFTRWIKNSDYNFDVSSLILSVKTLNTDMSVSEYYNALKKLGYNYNRFNKFKEKYFYRELNYKTFINKAINHLMYELENEEKQIISEMQYDLEKGYDK